MFRKLAIALSTAVTVLALGAFAANAGPAGATNKILVASFTVPTSPSTPGGPLHVTGSIQNVTNKALSAVDWTITDEKAVVLGKGTISIGGGKLSTVGVDFTPASGPHTLTFKADPLNKLGETAAFAADNVKTATLVTP